MHISVSNIRTLSKPTASDLSDISFTTGECTSHDLYDYCGQGYILSYTFRDDNYKREKGYMVDNYVGTDYICIDVDEISTDIDTYLSTLRYEPTMWHTTFSNMTAKKNLKPCIHIFYEFDQMIYGENNYQKVFDELTEGILFDDKAADPHRLIFTANSAMPNFRKSYTGRIYHTYDFISEDENRHPAKLQHKAHRQQRTVAKQPFVLDDNFRADLFNLSRPNFLIKYKNEIPYQTSTPIPEEMYKDGFCDLRDVLFYEVPSTRFVWDRALQKAIKPHINIGERDKKLWLDGIGFKCVNPDITQEQLVYSMVRLVAEQYDNSDGQLDNNYILKKAKQIFEDSNHHINNKPRKFKIDKNYWVGKGYDWDKDFSKIFSQIYANMRDSDFSDYNWDETLEWNVANLSSVKNRKINKYTLIKWLDEHDYPYYTDKDVRDRIVREIHQNNPELSLREIIKVCKDKGIEIKFETLRRILKK